MRGTRRSRSHSVKSRIGERYFQVFSDRSRSIVAVSAPRTEPTQVVCVWGQRRSDSSYIMLVLRLCDCVALTSRRSAACKRQRRSRNSSRSNSSRSSSRAFPSFLG